MSVTGILAAFIATICWAGSVFPFTKAGRLMTVQSMNLIRLVLGTTLVLITAMILDKDFFSIFYFSHLNGWIWLGISGIMALGIGDYFGLRMYTILSPRYGSVLTTLSPAMALLMGIILLNEQMNWIGIFGMAITVTGVMSMSLGRKERSSIPDHGHGSVFKGIIFGIISAFCNGAGLAFSKKGFLANADHPIHPITGSFIRFLIATIIVILFMLIFKKIGANISNIRKQPKNILGYAIGGVVLGPLLAVSFAMIAIQYINVAVAQTIFALVPVVALIISYFVYKEKLTRNALAGVIIAIIGVCILIWRKEIAVMLGM